MCNVYCPTYATDQPKFLDKLPVYIKGGTPPPPPLILGGDWKCLGNFQRNKFGCNSQRGTARLASFRLLVQTYGLVDIFYMLNPAMKSYTWYIRDSSIGCCLERFYITRGILSTSRSSATQFFPDSDHDDTSFEFTHSNTETRPRLLETQHVHFRRTNPTKPGKIILDILAGPETRL